ncbi:hypothetical protein P4234_16790 [Pseudomonas aeruginosa]|nr:hypothetical protein [Pseudomonas aeruginosa]
MKASKPGPKPSGKAKSAAQRMREYRARKAEEALGAEHSDKERERQIRREARAELERVKLEQQRREHTRARNWKPARPRLAACSACCAGTASIRTRATDQPGVSRKASRVASSALSQRRLRARLSWPSCPAW